jgi:flavodoxin
VNALVLYDSTYGNTERIAETVALALQESMSTRLAAVGDDDCAELLRGIDLLLVGGPTHRRGISEPLADALAGVDDRALGGVRVAVFDTRVHGTRVLTGSAAARLGRLVRRHGGRLVVPPESFVVQGVRGPLERGEAEHARDWTAEILRTVGVRPRRRAAVHAIG